MKMTRDATTVTLMSIVNFMRSSQSFKWEYSTKTTYFYQKRNGIRYVDKQAKCK